MDLQGKGVVVTGGASGIGLASARRFAAAGARVAVVDLDDARGAAAAEELGGVFIRADVSLPEEVARVFAEARTGVGPIAVAHLNAGVVTGRTEIADLTDGEYRRVMGVNVDHVVFGAREAIRSMRETDGGVIVVTASMAGLVSYAMDPIYALSKHAVVGLVRALGPQVAGDGIRVNCVCPGIVDTPLLGETRELLVAAGFPLIEADEVAEAVWRAATSEGTGEAWVAQAGREPEPYRFRGVPGPRTPGAEGVTPPGFLVQPPA